MPASNWCIPLHETFQKPAATHNEIRLFFLHLLAIFETWMLDSRSAGAHAIFAPSVQQKEAHHEDEYSNRDRLRRAYGVGQRVRR
jgi:hypothetical protein